MSSVTIQSIVQKAEIDALETKVAEAEAELEATKAELEDELADAQAVALNNTEQIRAKFNDVIDVFNAGFEGIDAEALKVSDLTGAFDAGGGVYKFRISGTDADNRQLMLHFLNVKQNGESVVLSSPTATPPMNSTTLADALTDNGRKYQSVVANPPFYEASVELANTNNMSFDIKYYNGDVNDEVRTYGITRGLKAELIDAGGAVVKSKAIVLNDGSRYGAQPWEYQQNNIVF